VTLEEYVAALDTLLDDESTVTKETGYSTDDYVILSAEDDSNKSAYQIVNREFGVIEYVDFILPSAINGMIELQDQLEKSRQAYKRSLLKAAVETDDEQGEDSIH